MGSNNRESGRVFPGKYCSLIHMRNILLIGKTKNRLCSHYTAMGPRGSANKLANSFAEASLFYVPEGGDGVTGVGMNDLFTPKSVVLAVSVINTMMF